MRFCYHQYDHHEHHRITSYNVCYTKLLRFAPYPDGFSFNSAIVDGSKIYEISFRPKLPQEPVFKGKFCVITSYSIHYTKLYDGVHGQNLMGRRHVVHVVPFTVGGGAPVKIFPVP